MVNEQAFRKEALDYVVRAFIPSKPALKLAGISDREGIAVINLRAETHPVFIKALREKYNGANSRQVYDDLMKAYLENFTSKGRTMVDVHEIWSIILNLSSERVNKIDRKLFPQVQNSVTEKGQRTGVLFFASQKNNMEIVQPMCYRNVNKMMGSMYSDRYQRELASINYLQAFIDYGRQAASFNNETIENLVSFYSEVNNRQGSMAFETWIDEYSWDFYKDLVLEHALTLKPAIFTKFIESDLPVKHWEENIDMPREWLINLYRKQ